MSFQSWRGFNLPGKGVTSPLWPEARVDKASLRPDDDEDDDDDDEYDGDKDDTFIYDDYDVTESCGQPGHSPKRHAEILPNADNNTNDNNNIVDNNTNNNYR